MDVIVTKQKTNKTTGRDFIQAHAKRATGINPTVKVPWDFDLAARENHANAAEKLAEKTGNYGTAAGYWLGNYQMVFVFEGDESIEFTINEPEEADENGED